MTSSSHKGGLIDFQTFLRYGDNWSSVGMIRLTLSSASPVRTGVDCVHCLQAPSFAIPWVLEQCGSGSFVDVVVSPSIESFSAFAGVVFP